MPGTERTQKVVPVLFALCILIEYPFHRSQSEGSRKPGFPCRLQSKRVVDLFRRSSHLGFLPCQLGTDFFS